MDRLVIDDRTHPLMKRSRLIYKNSLHQNLTLLSSLPARITSALYYPRVFASFGHRSIMWKPLLLHNPQFMNVGACVSIRNGARIQSIQTNPGRIPVLRIGDGTMIEQFVHIICHNRVIIGANVAIAPMCGIVDATHPWMEFSEITNPGASLLDDDGFVEIGDGTFIGMGSVVLPNVRIGQRCFIGANSVVASSIPDNSVAAGVPAKIIRTRPSPSAA